MKKLEKPIYKSEEYIKIIEGVMYLMQETYRDQAETDVAIQNLTKAINQLSELRLKETKGEL